MVYEKFTFYVRYSLVINNQTWKSNHNLIYQMALNRYVLNFHKMSSMVDSMNVPQLRQAQFTWIHLSLWV